MSILMKIVASLILLSCGTLFVIATAYAFSLGSDRQTLAESAIAVAVIVAIAALWVNKLAVTAIASGIALLLGVAVLVFA